MSDATPTGYPPAYGPVKTLAVRVSEDLRAQLDIIAQLNDRSVTEEIRLSIEAWIEKSKSDPAVLKRAESVRAEIEREAQTKRNAISSIFDGKPSSGARSGNKEG
jgi:uncharacterized membrane-anchored protein YjiN (DUF445 family)